MTVGELKEFLKNIPDRHVVYQNRAGEATGDDPLARRPKR